MPDGYLDLVSYTAHGDTCLVLPTLGHAVAIWPVVRTMFRERHDERDLALTKASIVCKDTQTVMRLWVPYERDPTMQMDYPIAFGDYCTYLSVWYTPKELKRIADARLTSFRGRERGQIEATRALYKRAGRRA